MTKHIKMSKALGFAQLGRKRKHANKRRLDNPEETKKSTCSVCGKKAHRWVKGSQISGSKASVWAFCEPCYRQSIQRW